MIQSGLTASLPRGGGVEQLNSGQVPPRFSIVIPSFNAGKYIEKTLISILKQRYSSLEVIVVDGGSSDDTLFKVSSFRGIDIKLISEPDEGQLDAVQKGLRLARGDILYWLNADDILLPGSLSEVDREFLSRPELDLIFSDNFAFDESRRLLSVGMSIRGLNIYDHILFYRQMYSECIFWRRQSLKFLGSEYNQLRLFTDYAFFSNLRDGLCQKWINKRLGAFRIVDDQMSQRERGRFLAEFSFIRGKIYANRGWTSVGVGLRRLAYFPAFWTRQWLWPRAEAAARKLRRVFTFDRRRRDMADYFFDHWLDPDGSGDASGDLLLYR